MRHYVSYIIKQKYKICDKNISKERDEKLRNYSKWKNWIKLFLINGSSPKKSTFLTKGHLGNQEGLLEVEYPPNRKLFWHLIQIKNIYYNSFGVTSNCSWSPGRWISTRRDKTFSGVKLCASRSFTLQQNCY